MEHFMSVLSPEKSYHKITAQSYSFRSSSASWMVCWFLKWQFLPLLALFSLPLAQCHVVSPPALQHLLCLSGLPSFYSSSRKITPFFVLFFLPLWQDALVLRGALGGPQLACMVSGRNTWLGARLWEVKEEWDQDQPLLVAVEWRVDWLISSCCMRPKCQGTLQDAVIELIGFSHFFNGCSTWPVNSASLTHIINPSNCSGITFVSKEHGCDSEVTY